MALKDIHSWTAVTAAQDAASACGTQEPKHEDVSASCGAQDPNQHDAPSACGAKDPKQDAPSARVEK